MDYCSDIIFYGGDRCPIADIDWSAVSQVTHAFCGFASDGSVAMDALVPMSQDAPELIATAHTHGVKVLLCLGILNVGSDQSGTNFYNAILLSAEAEAQRVMNAVDLYGYDGVVLDWEISPPGLTEAWPALTALSKSLRFKLGNRVLGACAFAQVESAGLWGNSEALSYTDRVMIMTYDLEGRNVGLTGYNSPLYGGWSEQSVDSVVAMYLAKGTPASKIDIGIPWYTWNMKGTTGPNMAQAVDHPPGAPPDNQIWGYNKIVSEWLNTQPRRWHVHAQVPSVAKASEWVSYDDAEATKAKIGYARARGLHGWFALGFGCDYLPTASVKHPLVQAMAEARSLPLMHGEPKARVRLDTGSQFKLTGSYPYRFSGSAYGLSQLGFFVFNSVGSPVCGNGNVNVVDGHWQLDINVQLGRGNYEIVVYGNDVDYDTMVRVPMKVL